MGRSPDIFTKETSQSTLSAVSVSRRSSSRSAGSPRAPVRSVVCEKDVSGRTASAQRGSPGTGFRRSAARSTERGSAKSESPDGVRSISPSTRSTMARAFATLSPSSSFSRASPIALRRAVAAWRYKSANSRSRSSSAACVVSARSASADCSPRVKRHSKSPTRSFSHSRMLFLFP